VRLQRVHVKYRSDDLLRLQLHFGVFQPNLFLDKTIHALPLSPLPSLFDYTEQEADVMKLLISQYDMK
jgi:hypothetical protein